MKAFYVYIMSSRSRNLYTGMTNNLYRRVDEHKRGLLNGFTRKYKTHRLVYYETHYEARNAIEREKQIKKWGREKKIALIMGANATWQDLAEDWYR